MGIFSILISLFLGLLISVSTHAAPRPQLYCNGVDYYGDSTWTHRVYYNSKEALVVYTETTGFSEPSRTQIRLAIMQGRIELPNPDGSVKSLYNLKTQSLEFYERQTNRPLARNPFDDFSCITPKALTRNRAIR